MQNSENRVKAVADKDAKGRVNVNMLDDRAIAEESLERLRLICDVFEGLATSPMAGAVIPPNVRSQFGA